MRKILILFLAFILVGCSTTPPVEEEIVEEKVFTYSNDYIEVSAKQLEMGEENKGTLGTFKEVSETLTFTNLTDQTLDFQQYNMTLQPHESSTLTAGGNADLDYETYKGIDFPLVIYDENAIIVVNSHIIFEYDLVTGDVVNIIVE